MCLARIALARASIFAARSLRPVFLNVTAKFSRVAATSGCSGPRAFSRIASARFQSGSASVYLPLKGARVLRSHRFKVAE